MDLNLDPNRIGTLNVKDLVFYQRDWNYAVF